jgi:hypothetical protein
VEVTTVASVYHVEMNPGDAGIYDRYIVQDVIKEIAQNSPLDKTFKGGVYTPCEMHPGVGGGWGGLSTLPLLCATVRTLRMC